MKPRLVDYSFILLTILFTVYGQLMVKWRVSIAESGSGTGGGEQFRFVQKMLSDPLVLTGLAAGFAAAICWILAMSKFQLSFAYPFMALNFVIVVLVSRFLFNEPLSALRLFGVALIVLGTFFVSRS